MYKRILPGLLFIFLTLNLNAQFFKSVLPSPDFNKALEKIVLDFRYNFKNIKSETVVTQGEVDTYESIVTLPGATNCVIYQFHSAKDTTASWQGVLYQGDDYKEAVKVYKNTFRYLNKSRMQLIDRSFIGFAGNMEEPSEDLRFAVSTLKLDVADNRYKRFAAELELVTTYDGWQVNVNFFNRKPDNERE